MSGGAQEISRLVKCDKIDVMDTLQGLPVRYHEEQYFRQWWVQLTIWLTAGLSWWGFYEQIVRGRPWGSNPGPDWLVWGMWLVFGIGFPLLFYRMSLVYEVDGSAVTVRFWPLLTRHIPLADIQQVRARTYQPIREYGGWGIRGWGSRRAYNVSGDQGVQLILTDGSNILLGSQQAQQLALAIETAQKV